MRIADLPAVFLLAVGGFLLPEVVVHFRHVRNMLLFRSLRAPGAIEGHLKYARWVTERSSTVDLVSFAALFALCFLLSERIMFLGGSFGCLASAQRHLTQARRART